MDELTPVISHLLRSPESTTHTGASSRSYVVHRLLDQIMVDTTAAARRVFSTAWRLDSGFAPVLKLCPAKHSQASRVTPIDSTNAVGGAEQTVGIRPSLIMAVWLSLLVVDYVAEAAAALPMASAEQWFRDVGDIMTALCRYVAPLWRIYNELTIADLRHRRPKLWPFA